jgi:hypothetical protein
MKKMIFIAFGMLTFSYIATAQTYQKNIPAAVKHSFEKQHPGVKATWDKEKGKYEASFKLDGKNMSNLYSAKGLLEESEVEIPVSDLPGPAAKYIDRHNLGKIKGAAKITKRNGQINYEAEIKNGDAMFDRQGKFIRLIKG